MGSRAHIAKIDREGTGRYLYLGHGCYPDDAGRILLEHYSEQSHIDALMAMGSIASLGETLEDSIFYHRDHGEDWSHCRPAPLYNGTIGLFEKAYLPGPEWLYCWTPDGWLAAEVRSDPPSNYFERCGVLSPSEFNDWFHHNQEPEWVSWRSRAIRSQAPQPLDAVIERYVQEQLRRRAGKTLITDRLEDR